MTTKIDQKCSSCVYYPSDCCYIMKSIGGNNSKVISILDRFMINGCKYYINITQVKGGDGSHDRKTE